MRSRRQRPAAAGRGRGALPAVTVALVGFAVLAGALPADAGGGQDWRTLLDRAATSVRGVMHRRSPDSERIDFFLTSTRWTGEIRNLEPGKCDELRWAPLDRLPVNTIPYVAAAIAAWRRGDWFSAFGWDAE